MNCNQSGALRDAERRKLCDALRTTHPSRLMSIEAADEIKEVMRERDLEYERRAIAEHKLRLVEETLRGLQIAFERGHNYD